MLDSFYPGVDYLTPQGGAAAAYGAIIFASHRFYRFRRIFNHIYMGKNTQYACVKIWISDQVEAFVEACHWVQFTFN